MRVVPRKEDLPGADLAGAAAAVIDVLRATSTAVAALAAGAPAVHPCAGPEEARRLAARLRAAGTACLLAGEVEAVKAPGFDLGNSPRDFTPSAVAGREVVLATTNGTRAVRLLPSGVAGVALASLLNAAAAAAWLAAAAVRGGAAGAGAGGPVASPGGAALVCAGTAGAFSFDDFLGAGAVIDRLEARLPGGLDLDDAARAARDAYRQNRGRLEEALSACGHADRLFAAGLGEDVTFCAREDAFTLVPVLQADGRAVAVSAPPE